MQVTEHRLTKNSPGRERLKEQGGLRWYAVQCLAHREAAAASHLQNQGFTVFLPRRQKTRRHARKLDTVLVPFFPGYLFVRFDSARAQWRSINGTHGVARMVMQGDSPLPAPRGIVEALQAACEEGDILRHSAALKPGQSVRIMAGAFADFLGRLEQMHDRGRVRVLIEIMGGRIPILLSDRDIVPESNSL
jgi:transcription elongation factor/antiterminator RfaH